jgi:molecular chaperone DnaJ
MARNHYTVLGIPVDASPEEIKCAYRRQAMQLHPDRSGPQAGTGPFREIQEAYDVLSDPAQREVYDRAQVCSRPTARDPTPPDRRQRSSAGYPGRGIIDPDEFPLRSMAENLFGPFSKDYQPFILHNQGAGILEIALTEEEARQGGAVDVSLPIEVPCPNCRGRGGLGWYRCARCAGSGALAVEYRVTASFPPGLSSHHAVQLTVPSLSGGECPLIVRFLVQETC